MPVDETIPTTIAGCISGSIGDVVFSRNQHGPYTRARTTPTYPASSQQQTIAAAMSNAAARWKAISPPTRALWNAYAEATPYPDRCGRVKTRTGKEMYHRAAIFQYMFTPALTPSPGPPTRPGLGGFKPIRIVWTGPTTYNAYFDDTEPWVQQSKGFMLIQYTDTASGQYDDTINFFRGPYESATRIDADLFTPPTSPHLFFGGRITTGKHRYARVRVLDWLGRLSNPQVLKIFP